MQSTLISRILGGFRNNKQIEPHREVFLQFDGDRLDPDSEVKDTEISDMDHIDVYIK